MVHETMHGIYQETNLLNEPADYLAKREELRLAEIELMKHIEQVAAMRRRLPTGAALEDYEFTEGPTNLDAGDEPVANVKLSELSPPIDVPS